MFFSLKQTFLGICTSQLKIESFRRPHARLSLIHIFNAAGASVALAVANPIVGIGSFLAQLIFKDPLSKLFSFEYQVTGTWSDPVVTKIKH